MFIALDEHENGDRSFLFAEKSQLAEMMGVGNKEDEKWFLLIIGLPEAGRTSIFWQGYCFEVVIYLSL